MTPQRMYRIGRVAGLDRAFMRDVVRRWTPAQAALTDQQVYWQARLARLRLAAGNLALAQERVERLGIV